MASTGPVQQSKSAAASLDKPYSGYRVRLLIKELPTTQKPYANASCIGNFP